MVQWINTLDKFIGMAMIRAKFGIVLTSWLIYMGYPAS